MTRSLSLSPPRPATAGRGHPRRAVMTVMALAGCLLFCAFLLEDAVEISAVDWAALPWGLIARYIVAMALGGALAGWLAGGLFGRAGLVGWLLSGLGAVLAAVSSGLFGSFFGLMPDMLRDGLQLGDAIAVGFGALVLPLAAYGHPWLLLGWLLLVVLAHLWACRQRSGAFSAR